MTQQGYVLGQSATAARRLELQDTQFGEASEWLLDQVGLRHQDRVVELGCGPGYFSRRILRRLGPEGVLVAVDSSPALLAQAGAAAASHGPTRFEPVVADIAELGTWLHGADAVVGRAVLHHVPMVEAMLGRLRAVLPPGTRIGFVEPDFRTLLARLAYFEAGGQTELAAIRIWVDVINQLYLATRLSPDIGPMLARALHGAGCKKVRAAWWEVASDSRMLENSLMFFDEVRERLINLNILSAPAIDEEQRQLRALLPGPLPAAWGIHAVACEI
jgi:ubiquinone/menaquinone biosynthesis C-methylase UbiE